MKTARRRPVAKPALNVAGELIEVTLPPVLNRFQRISDGSTADERCQCDELHFSDREKVVHDKRFAKVFSNQPKLDDLVVELRTLAGKW